MYGFLLESVQHFVVQECGEDVWVAILRESGAKHTVFNCHQNYPDTLMLRLAIALARRYNPDSRSPAESMPATPVLRKLSAKKRSLKKQSSQTDIGLKCPYAAALAFASSYPNTPKTESEISHDSVDHDLTENYSMSSFSTTNVGSPISSRRAVHGPNCKCDLTPMDPVKMEKFATPEKVLFFFGQCFVKFFSYYGYDKMIRANGRYFCVFLQQVDNIHQRMRFTFPRMRSPTMQLARAHHNGAELIYRSTRNGFAHYLIGQLCEIAEDIFSLKLKANIVKESVDGAYKEFVLKLEFDNNNYVQSQIRKNSLSCPLAPVSATLLLDLFPFGILLNRQMKLIMAGEKVLEAWGGPSSSIFYSTDTCDLLRLRKPKTSFTFDKFVSMQAVLFELELVRWKETQGARLVLLRGEMKHIQEIDSLAFLCSPIFNNLEEMSNAGLFLQDLNGHGLSRELLLTGWQHGSKLEILFEKAETRSATLENSMRLQDEWKKRGDRLLYSMIPKTVAQHLRSGKDPMAACQAFDSVTVMFCALQLTEAESRSGVMQTVASINDVYSKIDRLIESHRVYKVETVGSVYMIVSGAPERAREHATFVASAAIEISRAMPNLTLGVHSGPVVGGVLGLRLPRYCLVGDTVNTASRMQSTSLPGKIQITSATASLISTQRFLLRSRGLVKVKGKGNMETFWLEGEIEQDDQEEALQYFANLCENQNESLDTN